MSFVEERLLDCVSYGTMGGPTWKTRRITLKSGITRRNPLRTRPLYRFNVVYKNLLPEHHIEVINAYNACYGGVYGFRIKDWSDFQAVDELMSLAGTGAEQTLQLTKTYSFGNRSVTRPIRKPVDGTVIITANDVPIAATIDYTTGMATYTATNGSIVRWSGEFDVPVMFDDDELMFSGDDKGADGLFLTSDVALSEDLGA
jgi:uncharacterized protein (TIGR02217 family)